jgi:hypothetical protein
MPRATNLVKIAVNHWVARLRGACKQRGYLGPLWGFCGVSSAASGFAGVLFRSIEYAGHSRRCGRSWTGELSMR